MSSEWSGNSHSHQPTDLAISLELVFCIKEKPKAFPEGRRQEATLIVSDSLSLQMPPKRAFYVSQETPNVSPKLYPVSSPPSQPSMFPLSARVGLPGPGSMSVPRVRRPKKFLYVLVVFALLYWFGIRHGLGGEPPLPLGFAPAHGHRRRPRTMNFVRNGLAQLLPLRRSQPQPEHPFYELMERAEESWRLVRDRQSKTKEAAVKEYYKRYGMAPPAGFGHWYDWAKANGVELVDEYDLMMRDVLAHHALEPSTFISRSKGLRDEPHSYTLNITRNANVVISGERKDASRPQKFAGLINGIRHEFPEGFGVVITGSDHDVSSVVLGKDQRKRAMELVKNRQHFTADELAALENPGRTPAWGWFKACPLDSPANIRSDAEYTENPVKAFIHDHVATMDFCEFPQLKRLHGALCIDREDRSPSTLKPWLVHSKLPGDASFLIPPIEGFSNLTDTNIPSLGRWEDKLDPRVHWRGSTTGGISTQADWRDSHRYRLHLLFNGRKGNDTEWQEKEMDVMIPDGRGGYQRVSRQAPHLAQAYGDVKLAGKILHAPTEKLRDEIAKEIQFGPTLSFKDSWMFRYVLDVDGNGWSERFFRLLSSASPVLKMTMFADWHMVSQSELYVG